jgi:hypothetical protein
MPSICILTCSILIGMAHWHGGLSISRNTYKITNEIRGWHGGLSISRNTYKITNEFSIAGEQNQQLVYIEGLLKQKNT